MKCCLLHTFTQPARKNAANRNLLRQSFIAYIFRSQRAREQEQEKEQEQESKSKREKKQEQERERKNGKTPSLLRRIILRLGRITP